MKICFKDPLGAIIRATLREIHPIWNIDIDDFNFEEHVPVVYGDINSDFCIEQNGILYRTDSQFAADCWYTVARYPAAQELWEGCIITKAMTHEYNLPLDFYIYLMIDCVKKILDERKSTMKPMRPYETIRSDMNIEDMLKRFDDNIPEEYRRPKPPEPEIPDTNKWWEKYVESGTLREPETIAAASEIDISEEEEEVSDVEITAENVFSMGFGESDEEDIQVSNEEDEELDFDPEQEEERNRQEIESFRFDELKIRRFDSIINRDVINAFESGDPIRRQSAYPFQMEREYKDLEEDTEPSTETTYARQDRFDPRASSTGYPPPVEED